LVEDERGEAGVALVDLIVGEMEFNTSKIGKVEDPQTGGYMLTAENEGYNSAKEERPRKENELVHRVMHPALFDKNEEQLRERDSKVSKETEEQKRKTRDLAGFSSPAETGGSDDSAEVIVVYGSAKKRRFKIFTRENTGKKMEGGVRRELIKWKDY
jgi:pyruvate/2-oxoacid:ferredoxin oxidoreductase alpha subunit